MDTTPITQTAEQLLVAAALTLTTPRAEECLACFVARQLESFGCDGSQRFSRRFRDAVAPRATALLERLAARGAHCDCELFLNAIDLDRAYWTSGHWDRAAPGQDTWTEAEWPPQLPPCADVRPGSTRTCAIWVPISRDE